MILSDKTIKEYLHDGKIIVRPEFKLSDIRPAGIRLHLGAELLIPVDGQIVDLDGSQEVEYDKVNIQRDGYHLKPGQFILGSTYEKFQVPRNIICHVDGRSTVARIGLAIHCTSGIIDGNFEEIRSIVLEIKNQGPFDIILRYMTALAMLSFNELTTEIEQGSQNQYRGQEGVVAPNFKLQKQ